MNRYFAILLACLCFVVSAFFAPGEAKSATRWSAVAPPDERYADPEPVIAGPAAYATAARPAASGTDAASAGQERSNPLKILAKRIGQAWDSNEYDLYVPFYTWHNRLMYDSSHIRRYNEHPWGGGFGKSFFDEDGDSHSLYFMGFIDSNDCFQPIGGYAFVKNWYLDEKKDWALGLGYTLSITMRHEYDYIPLPLPLPIFSVQYKQLAVQATYIPGEYNDGNVLFAWLRWHFN